MSSTRYLSSVAIAWAALSAGCIEHDITEVEVELELDFDTPDLEAAAAADAVPLAIPAGTWDFAYLDYSSPTNLMLGRTDGATASLVQLPVSTEYAVASPTGTEIAYQVRLAPPSDVTTLHVLSLETLTHREVATIYGPLNATGNYDFTWSPDGRSLVYASRLPRDNGAGLFIVSSLGGAPRRFFVSEPAFLLSGPQWSPNGAEIAFVMQFRSGDSEIYTLKWPTGRVTRLVPSELSRQYYGLRWSPAGDKLAYMWSAFGVNGIEGGVARVTRADLQRQDLDRTTTSGISSVMGARWALDGSTLVYVHADNPEAGEQLRAVRDDLASPTPETLDRVAGFPLMGPIDVSPDGHRILYPRRDDGAVDSKLVLVKLHSGQPRDLNLLGLNPMWFRTPLIGQRRGRR